MGEDGPWSGLVWSGLGGWREDWLSGCSCCGVLVWEEGAMRWGGNGVVDGVEVEGGGWALVEGDGGAAGVWFGKGWGREGGREGGRGGTGVGDVWGAG